MCSVKCSTDILVTGYVRLTLNVVGKFLSSTISIYRKAWFRGRRTSQAQNRHEAVTAFSETSVNFQRTAS
jgi:hypothetical protein